MSAAAASPPNLATVHERLKAILAPYRDRLRVAKDGPDGMTMFGGTMAGDAVGHPTTCYFVEPLPTGDVGFTCKD